MKIVSMFLYGMWIFAFWFFALVKFSLWMFSISLQETGVVMFLGFLFSIIAGFIAAGEEVNSRG